MSFHISVQAGDESYQKIKNKSKKNKKLPVETKDLQSIGIHLSFPSKSDSTVDFGSVR